MAESIKEGDRGPSSIDQVKALVAYYPDKTMTKTKRPWSIWITAYSPSSREAKAGTQGRI